MTTAVKRHKGIVVPLVTPADEQGRLHTDGMRRVLERVVSAGCHVLVLGTTGEAPSVPPECRLPAVRTAVQTAAGSVRVYAGIGSDCPAVSLDAGRHYAEAGCDAVVAYPPSYYPLSPSDIERHFEWLADRLPVPLMLYNIPATTHMSIPLDTLDRLSRHPNIVGFKDSERDLDRQRRAVALWRGRDDFFFFTGAAAYGAQAVLDGADGVVPSLANYHPALYGMLFEAARRGDKEKALALQTRADELSQVLQAGRSLGKALAALKVALNTLGLCGDHMFPPLAPLERQEKEELARQLAALDERPAEAR